MPDQKLENLLNLALDVPEEEREKSMDLDVGYNREANTWDTGRQRINTTLCRGGMEICRIRSWKIF